MELHGHTIAVCSWSLRPTGMADLAAKMKQLGLQHVQLSLAELLFLDDKQKHQELGHIRGPNIQFTGGMMHFKGEDYSTIDAIRRTGGFVPDEHWPLRKRLMGEAGRLAQDLGMSSILAHVGFVPHKGDARYRVILDRVREIAGLLGPCGVSLLMETGQEPAAELVEFMHDLAVPNVTLNFDPANMILYGAGDPMEAIRILGPHIKHVHAKDATASSKPGDEWGAEVPFGTGEVNPSKFLKALKAVGYTGPLAIEREAGEQRMEDVGVAIEALRKAR